MKKVIFMFVLMLMSCFLLEESSQAAEHYVDTSILIPNLPKQADVENSEHELYGVEIGVNYIIYYDHLYNYVVLQMYDDEEYIMSRRWAGAYQFQIDTDCMILDQDNLCWKKNPNYSRVNITVGDSDPRHSIMYHNQDLYVGEELVFRSTLLRQPLSLVVQHHSLREGKTTLSSVLGSVIYLIPLVISVAILYLGLRKGLALLRTLLIRW